MTSPPSIKLWVECEVTAAVLYGCMSCVGLLKQCNSEVKTNKNLLRPSKRLNIAYSNYGA